MCGLAAAALVIALLAAQSRVGSGRAAGWTSDLEFLVAEARRQHAGPSRPAHSEPFAAAASALAARASELSDHRIAVEIQRLMAMLGDGHSLLYPMPTERMPFAMLPVDLYLFADGVFVVEATGAAGSLRGARVVRIGDRAVEDVLSAMAPYVSRDNDIGLKAFAPLYLATPAFLEAWDAADSPTRARLTVERTTGGAEIVTLEAGAARRTRRRLFPPSGASRPVPLYLRHADRAYWTEWLEEPKALYFQFNQVRDDSSQPLEAFARALGEELSSRAARSLIVDVRHNNGGNNMLLGPLVDAIATFGATPGTRVFVLTGRTTFSAAQNFVNRLERRLPSATFAGEPSMSSPNFTGEDNPVRLPFSGLTVSISNRYWQDSDPSDRRPWIAPHLPVALTSRAWLANEDPVLDAVLTENARTVRGRVERSGYVPAGSPACSTRSLAPSAASSGVRPCTRATTYAAYHVDQ
jgi:hypothetical protein